MRVVVIPCRNEGDNIGVLVRATFRNADRVVVANDGSTDDTARAATEAGALVVNVDPGRSGLAAVYCAGLSAAVAMEGVTAVAEMDAGGSHDPYFLPLFWENVAKCGYDVASGCRFGLGGSYRGKWQRKLLSWGGTLVTNILWGTRWRDATSGFVAYRPEALRLLLREPYKSRGHFYQTEMRLRARVLGLRLVEVPIDYVNSSSSLNWRSIREALGLVVMGVGKAIHELRSFGGRP